MAKFHYRKRPHGADQHILIYCLRGSGKVWIRNSQFDIEAGDFFFISMKIAHTYSADQNTPWTIYWVHFKGYVSNSITSYIEQRIKGSKGFIRYSEKCISLFNEMYQELERGYAIDHLVYANLCLWQFLTSFMYNDKFDFPKRIANTEIVDVAINYLNANIERSLVLEEIAATVNLSPSHFSSLFRKKTGFSPIEYFNHLKVQKACQFLLFTQLRIKEIAFEVGIDDPYYFSRMFTKIMGMSPNTYRQKRV
jgi:AraC-like DNA-binding protein